MLWHLDGVPKNKRLLMNKSSFIYTCPTTSSSLKVNDTQIKDLLDMPIAYYKNVLRDNSNVFILYPGNNEKSYSWEADANDYQYITHDISSSFAIVLV